MSPGVTTSGLEFSQQTAVDGVVLTLDDRPPTEIFRDLADDRQFQEALLAAARDIAAGQTAAEFLDTLEAAGVDALQGQYQSLLLGVARGDCDAAWGLLAATRQLGRGRSPVEDMGGALRLFDESDVTPTITARVEPDFFDRRRDQRATTAGLLATLAQGCAVRVVGSAIDLRRLAQEHRAELPSTSVREYCSTPRDEAPTGEGSVDAAQEELDPDGPTVGVLRTLAAADGESRSYGALATELPIDRSTVRNHASDLTDLGLAESWDGPDGHRLDLTPAGREYLNWLDEEIGVQRRLSECVRDTPKPSIQSVGRRSHFDSRRCRWWLPL